MEKIEEELRERFKRLRVEAGLSQVALATQANLSVQTIKDIEAGRKGAGYKVLESVSGVLRITIEELAGKGAPKVEKAVKFNPKKAIRYFDSIPGDIYELALEFGANHEVWDEVRASFADALHDIEARKKSKA